MSDFISAARLSGAFYREALRPLLKGRRHAAALLGWGSDVLGYDTERSTDHYWGPRVVVIIETDDGDEVSRYLDAELPAEFCGWPVRYGADGAPAHHHVTVATIGRWLHNHLGVDASAGMTTLDWLLTPQQKLLGVTGGAVYADEAGELAAVRRSLAWYPDELWRWLIACQWRRIAEEEAFVARTAEVGDETGSAVVASRLVRDAMRLALLLDRQYAPYQKWLGTAFARMSHHDELPLHLATVTHASTAAEREGALARAYSVLAHRHNDTGITPPVDGRIGDYHTRPAHVLMANRFVEACLETVTDTWLRAQPLIGSIDQAVDNTAILQFPHVYRRLGPLYSTNA